MSNSVLRPTAVDFAEIATAHENLDLQLEEQPLSEGSHLVGNSIRECHIRRNFGLIVVGIVTKAGEMLFNPTPEYQLEAGYTLIMLGNRQDLDRFARGT